MNEYETRVNKLLLDIFDKILVTEEKALRIGSFRDLSVAEMHTLEGIGLYGSRTMSETRSYPPASASATSRPRLPGSWTISASVRR